MCMYMSVYLRMSGSDETEVSVEELVDISSEAEVSAEELAGDEGEAGGEQILQKGRKL